jgi:hypothetical protein
MRIFFIGGGLVGRGLDQSGRSWTRLDEPGQPLRLRHLVSCYSREMLKCFVGEVLSHELCYRVRTRDPSLEFPLLLLDGV